LFQNECTAWFKNKKGLQLNLRAPLKYSSSSLAPNARAIEPPDMFSATSISSSFWRAYGPVINHCILSRLIWARSRTVRREGQILFFFFFFLARTTFLFFFNSHRPEERGRGERCDGDGKQGGGVCDGGLAAGLGSTYVPQGSKPQCKFDYFVLALQWPGSAPSVPPPAVGSGNPPWPCKRKGRMAGRQS
jgi:hypothetical protein